MRIACWLILSLIAAMMYAARAADAPAPSSAATPSSTQQPSADAPATAQQSGANAPAPTQQPADHAHVPTQAPAPASASHDVPDAIEATVPNTPNAPDAATGPGITQTEDIERRITRAALQLKSHEYADAEPQLQSIVDDLEHQTSRYDPSLVIPMTLLGDAQNGELKYKQALHTYEQAQHIARVSEGLHTPTQVDLIYREANTLVAMGQLDKANDRQEYAYETLVRAYGPFSMSLLPGLYKLAGWYERTSNIFAARGLFERAVQIIARANGDQDPAMIPALHGLAATYRDERFPPYEPVDSHMPPISTTAMPGSGEPPGIIVNRFGPGEAALIEIVKITEANPNTKPIDQALAELDLGDWYLMFDKPSRATPVYVHARQLMRDKAALTDAQIEAYFQPTVLYRPIPDNPPAPPPALRANPTEGHVEVNFTVSEVGEVGEMKTVSSEPEGLMDIKVRRGMRAARFRPRFEGDTPVTAPNQVYRHTFVYYPHAEGAPPDGSKQTPAKQDSAKQTDSKADDVKAESSTTAG
jgi:TonB family protein